MKKIFFTIVLLLIITNFFAQRAQQIAYIDMEYILENVPEYLETQNTLNEKVQKWQKKLDKQARYIELLKSDLASEKAILTKDLIEEKEEEITLKQVELRRLESLYFGSKGDMYLLRKQLVQPIQDQVYYAIQKIVARKKYDFVFDKSSELVMLYSNKKYDISELVLKMIGRNKKIKEKNTKKNLTGKENIAKKEVKKKIQKKIIEDRRKKRLEKRLEKRRILKEKKEALKKEREQNKKKQNNN